MKIRKLLLTCTAIAGISAAFAVAANAEPIVNNTYDKKAGTVSVTSDLSEYAGDQMTVILIPESAYKNLQNGLADKDILYIDQDAAKADSKIFQGMGVKGGKLDPGTYYLRVGGTNIAANGILEEKVVVGEDGKIYHMGNLVGEYVDSSSIDLNDAEEIIKLQLGLNNEFFNYGYDEEGNFDKSAWIWKAADIKVEKDLEDETSVDLNDAEEIIKLQLGLNNEFFNHINDETGDIDWYFIQ